jgi:hypothetical protein
MAKATSYLSLFGNSLKMFYLSAHEYPDLSEAYFTDSLKRRFRSLFSSASLENSSIIVNLSIKIFSFESIPLSIDERDPMVKDIKNIPKNIQIMQITRSEFVPAEMSP